MITHRRAGLNAVEVTVLILLIVVAIAIILPSFLRVGEVERRVACENHLRRIGQALIAFEDMDKAFPADDDWYNGFAAADKKPNRTFFTAIAPLLTEKKEAGLLMDPPGPNANLAKITPIRTFFCPSRRTTRVGPKEDYGAPHHVAWFTIPDTDKESKGWYGVIGNFGPKVVGQGLEGTPTAEQGQILNPVTMQTLRDCDGVSSTILVFHKGVAISNYNGRGPNDEGFPWLGNFWEHKRLPFYLRLDFDGTWNGLKPSELATSPHLNVMPVLFADGSVRPIAYSADAMHLARLCSWNDGTAKE